MKDNRTREQKYAAWVAAVNATHARGWCHVQGWVFRNLGGLEIDLSATNLDMLHLLDYK